jgi:hypothetical protein
LTNEARDLLKKLLKKKPNQRLGSGAEDAGPLKVKVNYFKIFHVVYFII